MYIHGLDVWSVPSSPAMPGMSKKKPHVEDHPSATGNAGDRKSPFSGLSHVNK